MQTAALRADGAMAQYSTSFDHLLDLGTFVVLSYALLILRPGATKLGPPPITGA